MSCNWEYFELRSAVYPGASNPRDNKTRSGRIVGSGLMFSNVYLDLPSLGIADFQGLNYTCNFAYVFGQLAKLKIIRASFPFQSKKIFIDGYRKHQTGFIDQKWGFSRLQELEKDQKKLLAAHLYVARRDRPEELLDTEAQLWMEDVTVLDTDITPKLFVLLSGDSARVARY